MKKFQSISNPNVRFVVFEYDKFGYDNHCLSPHVGWHDTMGDGETQHTPNAQVTHHKFTDFCGSLVRFVVEGIASDDAKRRNDAWELAQWAYSETRSHDITADKFQAATKVVYKPGKPRYFREHTFEITSRESARHDKRYHEIFDHHDGGVHMTRRLMGAFTGTMIHVWSKIELVNDLARSLEGTNWPGAEQHFNESFKLGWGWEECNNARSAFFALSGVAQMARGLDFADRGLNSLIHNIENKRKAT